MAHAPGDRDGVPPERTLKLTLAYDGTPFVGWQRQAHGVSIQGMLEDALARIEGRPVTVIGAGRTDAGVHALGQVASVTLTKPMEPAVLLRALNAVLPVQVRVIDVAAAPTSFHARYSARSKTYRYRIVNGPMAMPFERQYTWLVTARLDVARMMASAPLFEGEHDFAAFQATGGSVKTSVRLVHQSRLMVDAAGGGEPGGDVAIPPPGVRRLTYEITANGFLRHMVRAIVGTLVEIGARRREPDTIAHALASCNRTDAGATAPARGLCLVKVDYPE